MPIPSRSLSRFDVCIAGAGIIGLSLALELKDRGLNVLVLDQGHAMRESSWAAAGMLAALDPSNPPALAPLTRLSMEIYPDFLARVAGLSGHQVPFRTLSTLLGFLPENSDASVSNPPPLNFLDPEALRNLAPSLDPGPYRWLALHEPSINPRDLCLALPLAIQATGIQMRENSAWLSTTVVENSPASRTLRIETSTGPVEAGLIVHCTGARAASAFKNLAGFSSNSLRPRKGQLLSVALPPDCDLPCVVHVPGCYIVPRGDGRAVIGSTIEDCGFDKSISDAALSDLLTRATHLVPALRHAEIIDRWAGLRPGSPDGLPVLGAIPGAPGSYIAAGHFRMGILLAPATARLMAQLILDEPSDINLLPFTPQRLRG
jgi:glycine oxidase